MSVHPVFQPILSGFASQPQAVLPPEDARYHLLRVVEAYFGCDLATGIGVERLAEVMHDAEKWINKTAPVPF
jgi:hypothetical protein